MPTPDSIKRLLIIDCMGGLIAGVRVISLHQPLSMWENVPPALLLTTGAANIVYGLYSGRLALLARRDQPVTPTVLRFLVAANTCWALLCFALTVYVWPRATLWGVAHLVGEGIYVGALAWAESKAFFARIKL